MQLNHIVQICNKVYIILIADWRSYWQRNTPQDWQRRSTQCNDCQRTLGLCHGTWHGDVQVQQLWKMFWFQVRLFMFVMIQQFSSHIWLVVHIYLHWITGTEVKQLWTMSLESMAWCTQAVNCTSATWSEVLVGSRPIRWQGSDSTWWPNTPLEKWSNSTNARLATRLSKIIICSELISNKHTQRWQWHNRRSSSANSAVISQGTYNVTSALVAPKILESCWCLLQN